MGTGLKVLNVALKVTSAETQNQTGVSEGAGSRRTWSDRSSVWQRLCVSLAWYRTLADREVSGGQLGGHGRWSDRAKLLFFLKSQPLPQ